MKLENTFTALITPFTAAGALDEEGLRTNVRHQLRAGVSGLVALGTTGECPTLSEKEQEAVVDIVLQEVQGKIPLIVGTGCYSTSDTIEKTKKAEKWGAQGALVVTPYYNKPSQEGLYRHFAAVAQATSLPLIAYNVPSRTGVNLEPSTVKRLVLSGHLEALKECNFSQVSAILHLVPEFTILSGDDPYTLPLMVLGGKGVISVLSNLLPEAVVRFTRAASEGDFASAKRQHDALWPLFNAIFLETNPIPIKEAMNLLSLPAGPMRLPLCPMQEHTQHLLKTTLQQLGVLHETQCAL